MKKRLIQLSLIILLLLIFINSNYILNNIILYTDTFIKNLFFYTLIIYTISNLLVDYDLLSTLNPISYITTMSLISGFPSGTKYTKELLEKGYINEDTANYLITYTSYPNPLFVIGSISTIISKKYAIYLLISIYLSSFITSRIYKVKTTPLHISTSNTSSFTNNLQKAITSSIKTIILIYGTSIFSLIIALLLVKYISTSNIIYSIIYGIFDLTKGIFSTTLIKNKRISTLLILLFINLSSISIHLQVKSLINNTKVQYSSFLKGRIVSTLIAIIILFMLYSL